MNRIAILLVALGGMLVGGLLLGGAEAQQSQRTIRWFCFAMDADGEFAYAATVGSASRATAEAYARGQAGKAEPGFTGVVSCGSEYEQRALRLFAALAHTHDYAEAGHTHAAGPVASIGEGAGGGAPAAPGAPEGEATPAATPEGEPTAEASPEAEPAAEPTPAGTPEAEVFITNIYFCEYQVEYPDNYEGEYSSGIWQSGHEVESVADAEAAVRATHPDAVRWGYINCWPQVPLLPPDPPVRLP